MLSYKPALHLKTVNPALNVNTIQLFRFAIMEEKVTLSSVLRNFNLKVKF